MQAVVKDGSREGRGFSLAELKEVGLDFRAARNHGVPTDVWRTTKYDQNVEQLKTLSKSLKETPKKEKKAEQPTKPRPTKTTKKKKKIVKKKKVTRKGPTKAKKRKK
jgi:ribosomal L13e-like protein